MKNNIFVHLLVIVLLSVFFCSCENENSLNNITNRTEQTLGPNFKRGTTNQVESKILTNQKNEVNSKKVSDQNKGINTIEETSHNTWSVVILCVISILSLIIAVISILKSSKLNERLNRHRAEINQLRNEISNLNFRPQQQVRPTSNTVSYSEFSTLARRVTTIENKVNNTTDTLSNQGFKRQTNPHKEESIKDISQPGYFGPAISGEGGKGYFKRLLDSREEARFSVTVIGDSATYEPIVPLNAIKSSDAMDLAIEFEGLSKNEAASMTLKIKGKAQKMGEKWIIINKAVVRLN